MIQAMNKALGSNVIKRGSDPTLEVTFTPTGVVPIDCLLFGGLPRGRSVEVFGPPSTLKSYIAYTAIAQCQAAGEIAVLVDTEHSWDPKWAASLGADPEEVVYVRTELAEEAADAMEVALRMGAGLIVVDSIASFLPKAEARDDKGNLKSMRDKTQMARQAKFMSDALRKLNAANTNTAMLFLNQTRQKVGIVFGDPTTTPGGEAMKFYASYRLYMTAAEGQKESIEVNVGGSKKKTKETTTLTVRAYLKKSKLSKPMRDLFFDFDLTTGEIDEDGFIINQGVDLGFVKTSKSGNVTVFTYGKITGRGFGGFRSALADSPITRAKLRGEVLAHYKRETLQDATPKRVVKRSK